MKYRWNVLLLAIYCTGCTPLAFLAANATSPYTTYAQQFDVAYGPAARHQLDIYQPHSTSSQPVPIVVFIHGGGWRSGDKKDYRFVGATLAAAGWVAVLPNYRLYPEVRAPAFFHDVAQAVVWVHTHAAALGGDPSRIYLLGHSAGAHIAVMLALDAEYLHQAGGSTQWLQGVVGLAGPYDFLPFKFDYMQAIFAPPENYAASQPVNYVRADAPPLLLLQGLRDRTVDPRNAAALAVRVKAVGGRVTEHYYPYATHADLVAALSVLGKDRAPVLQDITCFISTGDLC